MPRLNYAMSIIMIHGIEAGRYLILKTVSKRLLLFFMIACIIFFKIRNKSMPFSDDSSCHAACGVVLQRLFLRMHLPNPYDY